MPQAQNRRRTHRRRHVLLSVALAMLAAGREASAACGSFNPWFQPTTVQRGDSLLVTATGVQPYQRVLFTFVNENLYPVFQMRYTTNLAQGSCVVNQEYLDTTSFAKGTYAVQATLVQGSTTTGAGTFAGELTVQKRTTPAPPPQTVSCGQPAHAWFGPSTVNYPNPMYVAAVARPGTYVDFYFDGPPGGGLQLARIGPAHSNCVVDQSSFPFPFTGQWQVHAGYWDENGYYNYVDLGTLTAQ